MKNTHRSPEIWVEMPEKKCKKCGSIPIFLGEEYGEITCACGNPKLEKMVRESVRVA